MLPPSLCWLPRELQLVCILLLIRGCTRDAYAGERIGAGPPLQLAQSVVDEPSHSVPPVAGVRRALIICGHPGDDEHRTMYAESVEKIYAALTRRYGFAESETQVWFGSAPQASDGPALSAARGLAVRENVEAAAARLRGDTGPDDVAWVFVLGHAHYDRRHAWLNLVGPDMDEETFGKLFAGLAGREQVFFITTPVSGFFIKPLSAEGRVVITATEADREVNETLYHLALAGLLHDPPVPGEFDQDRDKVTTLLDLYVLVARRTTELYLDGDDIPTEHAQLDDNGDGRGTEVQLDYLPSSLGGRGRHGRRPTRRPGDGDLAMRIRIDVAPGGNAP